MFFRLLLPSTIHPDYLPSNERARDCVWITGVARLLNGPPSRVCLFGWLANSASAQNQILFISAGLPRVNYGRRPTAMIRVKRAAAVNVCPSSPLLCTKSTRLLVHKTESDFLLLPRTTANIAGRARDDPMDKQRGARLCVSRPGLFWTTG